MKMHRICIKAAATGVVLALAVCVAAEAQPIGTAPFYGYSPTIHGLPGPLFAGAAAENTAYFTSSLDAAGAHGFTTFGLGNQTPLANAPAPVFTAAGSVTAIGGLRSELPQQ